MSIKSKINLNSIHDILIFSSLILFFILIFGGNIKIISYIGIPLVLILMIIYPIISLIQKIRKDESTLVNIINFTLCLCCGFALIYSIYSIVFTDINTFKSHLEFLNLCTYIIMLGLIYSILYVSLTSFKKAIAEKKKFSLTCIGIGLNLTFLFIGFAPIFYQALPIHPTIYFDDFSPIREIDLFCEDNLKDSIHDFPASLNERYLITDNDFLQEVHRGFNGGHAVHLSLAENIRFQYVDEIDYSMWIYSDNDSGALTLSNDYFSKAVDISSNGDIILYTSYFQPQNWFESFILQKKLIPYKLVPKDTNIDYITLIENYLK